MDAVRPRILALTPRAEKIALAIEDNHRMLAAIEHIDIVVSIDPDPANLLERPALWQFRPFSNDAVPELATSDNHRTPPVRASIRFASIAMSPADCKNDGAALTALLPSQPSA